MSPEARSKIEEAIARARAAALLDGHSAGIDDLAEALELLLGEMGAADVRA